MGAFQTHFIQMTIRQQEYLLNVESFQPYILDALTSFN